MLSLAHRRNRAGGLESVAALAFVVEELMLVFAAGEREEGCPEVLVSAEEQPSFQCLESVDRFGIVENTKIAANRPDNLLYNVLSGRIKLEEVEGGAFLKTLWNQNMDPLSPTPLSGRSTRYETCSVVPDLPEPIGAPGGHRQNKYSYPPDLFKLGTRN